MATEPNRKCDLEERLLDYAARIIRLTDAMPKSRAASHVASQLLRSGTAPLSHHGEAAGAESADDFIHKMSVGLKELKESRRWLCLIARAQMMRDVRALDALIAESEELAKIFGASIRTARSRRAKR